MYWRGSLALTPPRASATASESRSKTPWKTTPLWLKNSPASLIISHMFRARVLATADAEGGDPLGFFGVGKCHLPQQLLSKYTPPG